MPEYIEKEPLLQKAKELQGELFGAPLIVEAIKNAPTVDVVEVVRCKDCKYSSFIKSCSKYECSKGCGALKFSNDFCSYGAKMDKE